MAGMGANTWIRPYGVAINLHCGRRINHIPKTHRNDKPRVGADLCICPKSGIGHATDRKLPHGGDGGEHVGSPLRGGLTHQIGTGAEAFGLAKFFVEGFFAIAQPSRYHHR